MPRAKPRARKPITLPGGETAPNPRRGTDRRGTQAAERPADAMATALQARARAIGGMGSAEEQRACTAPVAGSAEGRCILALTGPDWSEPWQTWCAISAARETYEARYLGASASPQGAAVALMPEPMETDPSLRIDIRTAEERDTAAVRAWDAWDAAIRRLPIHQRWAVRAAVLRYTAPDLWRDAIPTPAGRAFAHGLASLTAWRMGYAKTA